MRIPRMAGLALVGLALVLAGPRTLGAFVPVAAPLCVPTAANLPPTNVGTTVATAVPGLTGQVTASARQTTKICGLVTHYTAATPTSAGGVTVGGTDYSLAAGSAAPVGLRVGSDQCLTLTQNPAGSVTAVGVSPVGGSGVGGTS